MLLGGLVVAHWSRVQATVGLSSGEADSTATVGVSSARVGIIQVLPVFYRLSGHSRSCVIKGEVRAMGAAGGWSEIGESTSGGSLDMQILGVLCPVVIVDQRVFGLVGVVPLGQQTSKGRTRPENGASVYDPFTL